MVLRRVPGWGLHLRATALAAGCVALLVCATPTWAADAPTAPDHSIKAPHYGDVLFHFYQDEYFNAISSLMVSQHFQRLPQHEDEAEVLRGGLLLSWGMHDQAGEVFERLIAQGTAPAVRDRAWFFLAKVRHARSLPEAALDALGRIAGTLPPALQTERGLLLAQVKLALGENEGAAQALNNLAGAPGAPTAEQDLLSDATRYARFNLGVAMVRGGDAAGGQRWLDGLGQSRAATEEQRSLRDQTNLALGFAALQRQDAGQAQRWLERVRLEGPFSNKALLGLGWASLARQQAKEALVPWQELLTRDVGDPAVQEARIALPFALAELGAPAEALQQYQQALNEYQSEDGRLGESITALQSGPWLSELLALNPGAGLGWAVNVDELPSLPHGRQLAATLAGNPFQEGFKALRDLSFLSERLQQWQDTLAGYQDMLALGQKPFAAKLSVVPQPARQSDLAGLPPPPPAPSAVLDKAREDADGMALATPREHDLLQRLSRTRGALAAAGQTSTPAEEARSLAATAERVRLLAGLLSWELAQAAPERLWQASKAIATIGAQRAQAQARLAALEQAQRDQAERFTQLGQRITALNQQIQALLPQLTKLGQEEATALQALAVADLQTQRERLAAYGTQARYAMAQLQDSARQPSPPNPQDDHAAPR